MYKLSIKILQCIPRPTDTHYALRTKRGYILCEKILNFHTEKTHKLWHWTQPMSLLTRCMDWRHMALSCYQNQWGSIFISDAPHRYWTHAGVDVSIHAVELSHKPHNAPVPYLTMHHFVTEMCTSVRWESNVTSGLPNKEPGPRLNIKTVLSTYGDFHVKDKTAVRTS